VCSPYFSPCSRQTSLLSSPKARRDVSPLPSPRVPTNVCVCVCVCSYGGGCSRSEGGARKGDAGQCGRCHLSAPPSFTFHLSVSADACAVCGLGGARASFFHRGRPPLPLPCRPWNRDDIRGRARPRKREHLVRHLPSRAGVCVSWRREAERERRRPASMEKNI
jgi:hypothetical protein